MAERITNFDVSEYLNDEESIAAYLSAIVEENDLKLLLAAIGDIAKARGMAKIASDSGLGRESLYKAFNPDAKPRFDTIIRVLNSLGLKIGFDAIGNKKSRNKPSPGLKKGGRSKAHLRRRSSDVRQFAGQSKK
jgi:probable addiction module antidote protein